MGRLQGDDRDRPGGAGPSAVLSAALERIAGGDRAAFALLYRDTAAKLFGICLRILTNRQEAEDALQEAYLTVWRRAGAFDPTRGGAITWLAVLTRNVAIDCLRARRVTPAPLDAAAEVADPAPLASETLVRARERHQLEQCLAELAPGDALFIRTAFLEGSTYAELARRADQPLATVKSRIRRALLRLRECLA